MESIEQYLACSKCQMMLTVIFIIINYSQIRTPPTACSLLVQNVNENASLPLSVGYARVCHQQGGLICIY